MSKPIAKSKLSFKQTLALLIVATLALFAASGYYFYTKVITDPDRVLSGMLDKSLQTSSVQRTVTQNSGQSGINQAIYLGFTPKVAAQSLSQLEENNMLGSTKVTTETLGTKDADYVRYNSISIAGKQPNDNGKIIGVWGKRGGSVESGQPPQFLDEALLSAVPFGNLNATQRKDMKAEIDNAKLYDYSKAEKSYEYGRPVITYTTELDPKALVQVLAKYVETTNVGSASALNPANYEGAQKIQIKIKVDALSRHLKTVEFGGSGRTETYRGYGLSREIETPKQTIDVNELQTRLQSIEQQR